MPDRTPIRAPSGSSHVGSAGRTPIRAPSGTAPDAPTSSGGNIFGNLLSEAAGAIEGASTGLAHLAVSAKNHPIRTYQHLTSPVAVKNAAVKVGTAEYHTWAPFAVGLGHIAKENFYTATLQHAKAERERHAALAAFAKWYHDPTYGVQAHPLLPLLDAASLISAGTARLAALGTLPENVTARQVVSAAARGHYQGPLREITVRPGPVSAPVAVRTLPRNAARAGRMETTDALLKLLPASTPKIGEYARAGRAGAHAAEQTRMRLLQLPEFQAWQKAFRGLDRWQRAAAQWIPKLPLVHDLDAHVAQLRQVDSAAARQQVALLTSPKFRAAYSGDAKVLAAVEKGRALVERGREANLLHGGQDLAALQASPFRHMRQVRGARFTQDFLPAAADELRIGETVRVAGKKTQGKVAATDHAPAPVASGFVRLYRGQGAVSPIDEDELGAIGALDKGRWFTDTMAIASEYARRNNGKLYYLDLPADVARAWSRRRESDSGAIWTEYRPPRNLIEGNLHPLADGTVTVYYPRFGRSERVAISDLETQAGRERLLGGPSADALAAEVAASGRPLPFYVPDVLATPNRLRRGTGRTTGLTPPASDVRTWKGTLFAAGELASHPDLLSPAYLRSVTRAAGLDLHNWVKSVSTRIPNDETLPHGFVWVRDVRGQQISVRATALGEHVHQVGKAFPEIADELGELTTLDRGLALKEGEYRLAVPRQLADELGVKLRAAHGRWRQWLWDRPTEVWRALVLNLRIPWLESNVVGNHVLAAIRFAGLDGLRAYVGALGEVKGVAAARRLMALPATRRHLTQEQMSAVFPEQTRAGTFIGTQLPTGLTARLPRPAQRALAVPGAVVSALPKLDRATEGFLRRVATETTLRGEARAVYHAMPRQTRDWQTAFGQALNDPAVQRLASRATNDALGNFLSLTAHEQGTIRGLIPFYAWYREITRIALKLPLDTPGRTDLIARLGQAQAGDNAGLPSYLRGGAFTGKLTPAGNRQFLALRSMNPYTTPIDLACGLSLIGSNNRAAGMQAEGVFHPFLNVLATTITRAASGDRNSQSALRAFYDDFLKGLPEVRAAVNPPSRLYPERTSGDLVKQFLGKPTRTVDPLVAERYAREGR